MHPPHGRLPLPIALRSRRQGRARLGLGLGLLLVACVEQTPDNSQPSEEDIQAARTQLVAPDKLPTLRYPVNAVLTGPGEARIVYLGMDADSESLAVGKPVTLNHYFRVEKPAPEGWRLFVHVDSADAGGRRSHFTADHVPMGGKYPVARWQAGEIIRDSHRIALPPAWVGDKAQVLVGLWKGNARFAVQSGRQDGQNRVIAAEMPTLAAAPPPPRRLLVRKLAEGTKIQIDGKFDEPAWSSAESSGPFVNTMDGSPVAQVGSVRALWDEQNLYLAFRFADNDIWANLEKHDDKLWTQEVAEVFIDADGDARTYVELQVSPKNVTFDSWLPAYRANDNAWESGMETAVQIRGTLNQRDDEDQGWDAEMRIPLSAVKGKLESMRGVPPVPGTIWRANFFRFDFPKGKQAVASGWSPPLVGDFHALARFGQLVFADAQGTVPSVNPTGLPPGTLPPVLQNAALANPPKPVPTGELPGKPASATAPVPGMPTPPATPQLAPPPGFPGAPAAVPAVDPATPAKSPPAKPAPAKPAPAERPPSPARKVG